MFQQFPFTRKIQSMVCKLSYICIVYTVVGYMYSRQENCSLNPNMPPALGILYSPTANCQLSEVKQSFHATFLKKLNSSFLNGTPIVGRKNASPYWNVFFRRFKDWDSE